MSNPNLQQDIRALLSRAKQELEFITASERLALDVDLKVSIAIFSYLLCTVLDQLWKALALKYGVIFKKAEYYPCLTKESSKNIETELEKRSIPAESKAGQAIKESQPYLKSNEEDRWLKHLRYFRNFNSHSELSAGEQYVEFDFIKGAAKTILNISYKELDGSIIEIRDAHAFLSSCLEEVQNVVEAINNDLSNE